MGAYEAKKRCSHYLLVCYEAASSTFAQTLFWPSGHLIHACGSADTRSEAPSSAPPLHALPQAVSRNQRAQVHSQKRDTPARQRQKMAATGPSVRLATAPPLKNLPAAFDVIERHGVCGPR